MLVLDLRWDCVTHGVKMSLERLKVHLPLPRRIPGETPRPDGVEPHNISMRHEPAPGGPELESQVRVHCPPHITVEAADRLKPLPPDKERGSMIERRKRA